MMRDAERQGERAIVLRLSLLGDYGKYLMYAASDGKGGADGNNGKYPHYVKSFSTCYMARCGMQEEEKNLLGPSFLF